MKCEHENEELLDDNTYWCSDCETNYGEDICVDKHTIKYAMEDIQPTLWNITYIPNEFNELGECEWLHAVGVDMDLETAEMLAKKHYAELREIDTEDFELEDCWYNSVKEVDGFTVILKTKEEL